MRCYAFVSRQSPTPLIASWISSYVSLSIQLLGDVDSKIQHPLLFFFFLFFFLLRLREKLRKFAPKGGDDAQTCNSCFVQKHDLAPPSLVPPYYQPFVFWLPIYSQKAVLKIKCSKIKCFLTTMFKIKFSKINLFLRAILKIKTS